MFNAPTLTITIITIIPIIFNNITITIIIITIISMMTIPGDDDGCTQSPPLSSYHPLNLHDYISTDTDTVLTLY
jgi:hypothetical protein